MAKENGLDSEESVDLLQNLFNYYISSSTALQMQDVHLAEQNTIGARVVRKRIGDVDHQEFELLLDGVVAFIEASSVFLKANGYIMEERYAKAEENLTQAKQITSVCNTNLRTIQEVTFEDDFLDGLLISLRFSLLFFDHVFSVMQPMSAKLKEQLDGKYVNLVELYNAASVKLRDFKYDDNFSDNPELAQAIAGCVGLLGRMADIYERKAERLQERQKLIQFIAPHDNKVFIIHGHAEGALRELKELLRDHFNIEPIILKEAHDNGKTVIEKLEEYGQLCGYAFAIVSPDDMVENNKKKVFQARPNVLFELGWFSGRFGRSKIRILRQRKVDLPSDLGGLITADYEVSISELFLRIKTDLTQAGLISGR